MGFPFVDLQTILSIEIKITLVTLKAFALLLRVLVGFQTSCRRLGGGLLQKKLLPFCFAFHLSVEGLTLYLEGGVSFPLSDPESND